MGEFNIKSGDRLPYLRATLVDASGTPVSIALADSVFFNFKTAPGGTPWSRAANVIDAPNGVVEYRWQAGDTNQPGEYLADFSVNFGSEEITFPNNRNIQITIFPEVN